VSEDAANDRRIVEGRDQAQATSTAGTGQDIDEYATHQELSELPLDELREAHAIAGLDRRVQEGLQVLGDDLMEHGVLGISRAIHRLGTRHPSGYRAASGAPMPRDGYTRPPVSGATGVATRGTASAVWAHGPGGRMWR
jgi:hypothetical protein